jgi:hypothetical protein
MLTNVRFEVFTAVTMKMESSGMLRSGAIVRTDVSEELSVSFIRVTRIDELRTMVAVTCNRLTLRSNGEHSSQEMTIFIFSVVGTPNPKIKFQAIETLRVVKCYGSHIV